MERKQQPGDGINRKRDKTKRRNKGHWALAFLNRSDGKTVGVDGDGNRVGERGDHQIFHYPVVDIAEVVLFKPLGSNFGLRRRVIEYWPGRVIGGGLVLKLVG
ncbi:hypothetical protein FXO37_06208 [Capsicum annuum]|nr:hypothetical protein FXO37_06208 [Capsicum annuum]